jgi:hypothetical protein
VSALAIFGVLLLAAGASAVVLALLLRSVAAIFVESEWEE